MKIIKVIYIVGSSSCKRNCLFALRNKIGGACLDFSTLPFERIAQSEKTDKAITDWIKSKVKDKDIIHVLNLPPSVSKKWLQRTYPDCYFRHTIWEIHSHTNLEHEIIKERSISLVFGKLPGLVKKAKALGLNTENQFIKHTPIKQGLQYDLGQIKDLEDLVREVSVSEMKNSSVYYSRSIICEDGLKKEEREKSAEIVSSLITF